MSEKQRVPFRKLSVFQQQKRMYFANLSLQGFNEFKLHKEIGLWDKKDEKDGQATWINVSEHCLVEMARVRVLATLLNLSDPVQKDLLSAAALHDFYKEQEIKIAKAEGSSWSNLEKSSILSTNIMKSKGFRRRAIGLANAVAHGSLEKTQSILQKEVLSEDDVAFLIMHYVDDFTRDSDWVEPAIALEDGTIVNDLDRRMEKNEENKVYTQLNEEGRRIFHGETTFQAQRRIGHQVEDKLAQLICRSMNRRFVSRYLPEIIDEKIKNLIASITPKT